MSASPLFTLSHASEQTKLPCWIPSAGKAAPDIHSCLHNSDDFSFVLANAPTSPSGALEQLQKLLGWSSPARSHKPSRCFVYSSGGLSVQATCLHVNKPSSPSPSRRAPQQQQRTDVIKLLLAGMLSAIVTRTLVAPLERVKMEMVLNRGLEKSSLKTAVRIFQTEGLCGFWKGNGINVLRTAPFKAVNFLCFDLYRKALASVYGEDVNSARFTAGALAGITATGVCFPLDVLRTRLMAGTQGHGYGGLVNTLIGIIRYEGLAALYSGCVPALIGMAPAGAVYYGVYDLLKSRHLTRCSRDDDEDKSRELPSTAMLMYGAIAGACSEMVVYPLEVVRRKMQLQSMASASVAAGAEALQAGASHVLVLRDAKAAGAARRVIGSRLVSACRAIVQADGMKGFYMGLKPNMLQVLPSAALSYWTYDTMRSILHA